MSLNSMEPMMPSGAEHSRLTDVSTELVAKTRALSARLHPIVLTSIGDLVRSMNCYYSNLIEGHNTHPRDIDKALHDDFSKEKKKRVLQLEAKAHIEVQRMIDFEQAHFSLSADFIQWIHREFCERLPEELLWVENPDNQKKIYVEAGKYRQDLVQVGRHLAPNPKDIANFMQRFSEVYQLARFTKIEQVIAVAASHHRLLWIHPFLDGNGRVARLFSHAFLCHIGVGSSLWSISRGFARNVEKYKSHLMNADKPRQGDLDGRGALSSKGLAEFCVFFLETCVDQVDYMHSIIEPSELSRRMELFCADEMHGGRLPKGAWPILREVLFAGEMERGRAAAITGYQERQARTILNALVKANLLVSDTPKSSVRLNFPLDVIERWFPKLYPLGV